MDDQRAMDLVRRSFATEVDCRPMRLANFTNGGIGTPQFWQWMGDVALGAMLPSDPGACDLFWAAFVWARVPTRTGRPPLSESLHVRFDSLGVTFLNQVLNADACVVGGCTTPRSGLTSQWTGKTSQFFKLCARFGNSALLDQVRDRLSEAEAWLEDDSLAREWNQPQKWDPPPHARLRDAYLAERDSLFEILRRR